MHVNNERMENGQFKNRFETKKNVKKRALQRRRNMPIEKYYEEINERNEMK